MNRPTFDSLILTPKIGSEPILFKESQAGMPADAAGGMPPEIGQSPVTGNPDEMQAPESANQKQFEDDFGTLAYQFVNDRAPALVPYMLGFEVVEKNEDGSKAVGIFGYKIGDDFYYIPAFFLNNQVRGVDMILNKKTNQFVPLTEKWIDFIVNKHSVSIGGPADDRVRETMRNPDLSFVQRPQIALGKIAEDSAPWTFGEAWQNIKQAAAHYLKQPEFIEILSGITSAQAGRIEKCAESTYVKDFMEKVGGPECMSSFFKAMHEADFANAYLTLYKDAEACYTENTVNAAIHVDRMKKIAAARPKVRIVDAIEGLHKVAKDEPATNVEEEEDYPLTVEENARQIIEHDFTIEDVRPKEDVSKVTEDKVLVDFERRFNPPDGPGRYNFVMSDGMVRSGILLNPVMSPLMDKFGSPRMVVFEDDGNILACADQRSLITTEFNEEDDSKSVLSDELKDLYDRAKPMYDIELGEVSKSYLFIDKKGNAAGPFRIRHVMTDGDDVRFNTCYGVCDDVFTTSASKDLQPHYGFMDWDLTDRYHDFDGRRESEPGCEMCEPCSPTESITIGSFSGLPRQTSIGVVIPSDWKAIELKSFPRYSEYRENESNEDRAKRENKIRAEFSKAESKYTFGGIFDILKCMREDGVERIKIASDGTDYYVHVLGASRDHGPMNYKSAAVDLVTRFGLRPRRAFNTLAKAASGEPVKLLVGIPSLIEKSAQIGSLVNVAMPAPVEQLPSTDPYSGVPVYQSPYIDVTHGQFTGVPGLPPEGGMTRGINIGGEMERNMGGQEIPDEHNDSFASGALPIDEEAKRLAQEAAAAGQRHVFDQAAIGGLVKVYDTANVVDSYIPDFMDTLDRLGRVLFLFYWKHEDFNQRYGSDDVVQMEDSLRNVFKNLGELTLNLKEKSVQKE